MDGLEKWRLPDDLSFEAWVNYVIDHTALEPEWWWEDREGGYRLELDDGADHVRILSFLTRLFREPEGLIGRFSRGQIDQGLNFIVSEACSNWMIVLRDCALPWPDRRACFDAMIPLYEKLMAPVYQDALGHDETFGSERGTFSCYMWWDVIGFRWGIDSGDRDRINDAVLNVFEEVLKLKAESCIESVLHGLGHWHRFAPERTERIVRGFLAHAQISPVLRRYGEFAAVGRVL
jgi:hypothetical protein